MNAPATPVSIFPDVHAPAAPGLVAINGTYEYGKVSFGSEASLFHQAMIPTIIGGPGHIAQAHQANGRVTLEQLAQFQAFMHRFADRVCAG
jgi:acetylornithine deacetylase/succinyl-diaminopimelate desuccinylase-like protein